MLSNEKVKSSVSKWLKLSPNIYVLKENKSLFFHGKSVLEWLEIIIKK